MWKSVLVVCMAAALIGVQTGCDAFSEGLPGDLGKWLVSSRLAGSGDVAMDQTQLQQQDRLKDGTGDNCPNARSVGDQIQLQQQLRDGSCEL